MRSATPLLLALFAVLVLASPGAGTHRRAGTTPGVHTCALCADDAGKIECRRCSGEGHRERVCARCSGDRRIECLFCEDGKYTCPACGGEKSIGWESGETDPCEFCRRRGTLNCEFCRSGRIRCFQCDAKGSVVVDCGACLTLGWFPCPNDRPSRCDLCRGKGSRACTWCDGVGTLPDWCPRCGGSGERHCGECTLGGARICDACYATGVTREIYEGASKSNAKGCERCRRSGTLDCGKCDEGIVPCEEDPRRDCPRCEDGLVPCTR